MTRLDEIRERLVKARSVHAYTSTEDPLLSDLAYLLALLDERQKPMGFEEWWAEYIKTRHPREVIPAARDAWNAATLSVIPAEIRKTLSLALRVAHSNTSYSMTAHHHGPGELERMDQMIASFAAAREWLEGK